MVPIVAFLGLRRIAVFVFAGRDAMLTGLGNDMPAGVTWTVPAGGFYVWVTLPPGLDSQAMLPRAVTARASARSERRPRAPARSCGRPG